MQEITLEGLALKIALLEERINDLEKHLAPQVGMTIEEAKSTSADFDLTEEDIEYAMGIAGIWRSGIKDLSENFRDYFRD